MKEGDQQLAAKSRRRRSGWRWLGWGLLVLVVAALAALWLSRIRIASGFVEREFARRGVQASYKVTRVGFRTQRIENLVIGNPRAPDLTARWVEVDVTLGFRRIRADLIRARGVRLHGRIVGGRLTLGEVDKLMPPPTGKPFRLPNQRVEVADASLRLDTPAGRVGLSIEGSGNLAYSFEGKIAAAATALDFGRACRIERAVLFAAVRTEEERPSFDGPLKASRVACGGAELLQPVFALETTLLPGFDGGRGNAGVAVAELRAARQAFRNVGGRVTFDGGAKRVQGAMNLAAAAAQLGAYRTGQATVRGRYSVSPRSGTANVAAEVAARNVSGDANLEPIAAALGSAGGTPVEPIADALAGAVRRLGRSFDAAGSVSIINGRRGGVARVQRLQLASRSGARVMLSGREGLTYGWPGGRLRVNSDLALVGGGFPSTRLSLSQARAGGPISGTADIAGMAADGARLQLSRIAFTAGPMDARASPRPRRFRGRSTTAGSTACSFP
jgi:hypothetical protein